MVPEIMMFGYSISCRGLKGDVARAREFIAARQDCRYMACANPHSLAVAWRDPVFAKALQGADILLPDGKGIIFAAKALGLPLSERVAGLEFFLALTEALSKEKGGRYFFLGSTDQVLKLITRRLEKDFPNIEVVGTLSPPFKSTFDLNDNQRMIEAVNASQPDVLWVGMTAPKQEKWIYQNLISLQVPFVGAIGAAFDYYAGTKERAGLTWQKLGLEWVPRFYKEPRRLWKRYLISLPIFFYLFIKEIFLKSIKIK